MPTVSVIVPNYNHAPYLQQRIESILNQTYQDFEVIILDDFSTDDSQLIIETYRSNQKISHIVYNETNSGSPFKQWDKGIHLAKGEYIWIAESDDWCEPSLLSTIIKGFDKNKNIVLGYVQSYFIIESNIVKWVSNQRYLENTMHGIEYLKKELLFDNAIFNASMAVFRKSAYINLSLGYKDFKFCGDWLFWASIARQGDVFISGKILNYFRNHQGDVSSKAYVSGYNFIEEIRVLFIFLDNEYITNDEFLKAIRQKHIDYQSIKSALSLSVQIEIETLFYKNIHTKQYKKALLQDINRSYIKYKKIKSVVKRKIKPVLNTFGLWK
jgi:glycosyltransferase involved in cell wall biosynthesis